MRWDDFRRSDNVEDDRGGDSGGYGGGMIYYCAGRTVVFRTEHTRRSFVERVDFISAAGSTPPEVLRLGGPSKVVTPKATLRFASSPEAAARSQFDKDTDVSGYVLRADLSKAG